MTHSLFDLSRKIALATGSSQGIGFGIARGLGQAGATLILNGRNGEKLNRAVSKDDSKTTEANEAISTIYFPLTWIISLRRV